MENLFARLTKPLGSISSFHRSVIQIGIGLTLPLIIVIALSTAWILQDRKKEVEAAALSRAQTINALTDAQIERDFSVLRVLASNNFMHARNWGAARERMESVLAINKHWRKLVISDLKAGVERVNTARPLGNDLAPIEPAIAADARPRREVAGRVTREGTACPCVYLHVPLETGEGEAYVLSLAVDPHEFETILNGQLPPGTLGGIFDRDARFIARNVDFNNRVGTPGTRYVQEAVARGGEGQFPAVSWEGFKNVTAYTTSKLSGWSAHVAVAAQLVNRPRAWSTATLAAGGILALILAGGLIAFALADMAARRRAEERLAQARRMEEIGQLAGSIAHDLNNLLTPVIGGLDLILRGMTDERHKKLAANALEAARRGERLTQQLLSYARGHRLQIQDADLGVLISGMGELLSRALGSTIALDIAIDPAAGRIRSDPTQLESALMNLILNARDAMPQGGHVAIKSYGLTDRGLRCVALSVTDTGLGMSADAIARASEPFYTTKPAGKGTGLGLAQVASIVRHSGGRMQIESALGKGTTISLIFPTAIADSAPKPVASVSEKRPAHILVVDDDDAVRKFICGQLGEAGYSLSEAVNGAAALKAAALRVPDLLVTDFSMPGMTGTELAEKLRQDHPALPVIVISGYIESGDLRAFDNVLVLTKPITLPDLFAAIDRTLSASASRSRAAG